jgi:hypothetical protein
MYRQPLITTVLFGELATLKLQPFNYMELDLHKAHNDQRMATILREANELMKRNANKNGTN